MNMASLGTSVLTALIPGLLAAFSLPLIKKRKSAAISAAAALTVAAAFFLRGVFRCLKRNASVSQQAHGGKRAKTVI